MRKAIVPGAAFVWVAVPLVLCLVPLWPIGWSQAGEVSRSICDTEIDLCDSVYNEYGSFHFSTGGEGDFLVWLEPGATVIAQGYIELEAPCYDWAVGVVLITDCIDPGGSTVASGNFIRYTSPEGGLHYLLLRDRSLDCDDPIRGEIWGRIAECRQATSVPDPVRRATQWGEIKMLFR